MKIEQSITMAGYWSVPNEPMNSLVERGSRLCEKKRALQPIIFDFCQSVSYHSPLAFKTISLSLQLVDCVYHGASYQVPAANYSTILHFEQLFYQAAREEEFIVCPTTTFKSILDEAKASTTPYLLFLEVVGLFAKYLLGEKHTMQVSGVRTRPS
jgi:hypothetical protein